MYPDCAEQIMRIYEADKDKTVSGINAIHVPAPPDRSTPEKPSEHGTTKRYGPLARLIRSILRADDIFVPYDADFPQHTFPTALSGLPVGTRKSAAGWGMTFRGDICLKEPFEEILSYYAAGEDFGHGVPCLTSRIDADGIRSATLSSWRDRWPLAPICRPGAGCS